MITGDHADTARTVGGWIGIHSPSGVLTGPQLQAMTDAQLQVRAFDDGGGQGAGGGESHLMLPPPPPLPSLQGVVEDCKIFAHCCCCVALLLLRRTYCMRTPPFPLPSPAGAQAPRRDDR